MKIILWVGLSILAGWLYRRGGTSKGTLWRDLGVSLVTVVSLFILGIFVQWWAYVLVFGLSWGALASYWGLDEQRWGYWTHGLGLSFALLPIAYATGHWLGFAMRCIFLTASITIWSEFIKEDVIEEMGRGFLTNITLLLLLI